MNEKKSRLNKAAIILTVLLAAALIVASYFVGYKKAYDDFERGLENAPDYGHQTFYARVLEISDGALLVEGIPENDINFRGQFRFSIQEETELEWRYTEIEEDDLDVGDLISITFIGPVQESDPAGIQEVTKVQLLDDEK
ncbi:MAG: hypothetical protein IJA20_05980 [Methanocorpusculum sp.]|nr:hypothetical protein [Methanocorpusculum sp.]